MKLYDDYHNSIVSPGELDDMVKRTVPRIKDWLAKNKGNNITHIAATGTSGLAAAYPLSLKLNLPVLAVRRKGGEPGAHSGALVGSGVVVDYIFVDDFVSSGRTLDHVVSSINTVWEKTRREEIAMISDGSYIGEFAGPRPICRAGFCYQAYDDKDFKPTLYRGGEYETPPFLHSPNLQKQLEEVFTFAHPAIKCFAMLDEH